jgi:hypothetical protein
MPAKKLTTAVDDSFDHFIVTTESSYMDHVIMHLKLSFIPAVKDDGGFCLNKPQKLLLTA